jgi:phospholipid/cholesterol/gamma-HCH transport system ATP-binding protein
MTGDRGEPILRFEKVGLYFDEQPALDNVSFALWPGSSCVILGAAGSGKTVLLKTAIGLIKPDRGRVWLFGRDITAITESELVDLRSRVGILFQEGGLFDSLTIEENVAYPLLNQRALRCPRDEVRARVEAALARVELEHTLEKYPSELSGGMRRRVGIARANVTEPPLVLYDSPTAGLDPITAHTIMTLILKERDTKKTTTVIVTHRYQDGYLLANFRYNPASNRIEPVAADGRQPASDTKFLVMREGRLVFEGSQAELEASPDPYVKKFVKPLRNW